MALALRSISPRPATVRLLGPCAADVPSLPLPVLGMRVTCGFPSPADDFMGEELDLHQRCVSNPAANFFAQAEGDSMEGFGIFHGDMLVVDRSVDAKDGDIALVLWEGGLTVKKLRFRRNSVELVSGSSHPPHPGPGWERAAGVGRGHVVVQAASQAVT